MTPATITIQKPTWGTPTPTEAEANAALRQSGIINPYLTYHLPYAEATDIARRLGGTRKQRFNIDQCRVERWYDEDDNEVAIIRPHLGRHGGNWAEVTDKLECSFKAIA